MDIAGYEHTHKYNAGGKPGWVANLTIVVWFQKPSTRPLWLASHNDGAGYIPKREGNSKFSVKNACYAEGHSFCLGGQWQLHTDSFVDKQKHRPICLDRNLTDPGTINAATMLKYCVFMVEW